VYISVSEDAIRVAILQDGDSQQPVYSADRVLDGAKTRNKMVEEVVLDLIYATRRLRPYFQIHQVVVKTNYPIFKIIRKI